MSQATFRARLAEVRRSLVPFYGLGSDVFHPVMVRPSLGFALVPRPRPRRSDAEGQRTEEHRRRERIAAALDPAEPGRAGLVEGSKFDAMAEGTSGRQGLTGLPRSGARKVEDLCSLVAQDRGLYAIWTVTLPHEVALELDALELGAQKFGDSIRRRFNEALSRAAAAESQRCKVPVLPHWWYVVEPQKAGRPHWHFVFRCKARRGRSWLLGKGRLDRLIRNAFRTVTGSSWSVKAAGNVQALRKNPGRYLSKYLRKGEGQNGGAAVLANGWSLNLVPLRWWGCSRSASRELACYVFPLPSVAVGWLSLQWRKLAAIGALSARLWEPPGDGAPTIVCGNWLSIDALERAVAHLFCLAERSYDLGRTYGHT